MGWFQKKTKTCYSGSLPFASRTNRDACSNKDRELDDLGRKSVVDEFLVIDPDEE